MSGPLVLPLFEYQEKALKVGLGAPYLIYALEMGLGKSPLFMAVNESLKNQRCLIICPASLTLNWEKELFKFTKNRAISVFRKSQDFYHPFDSDYVICSYDLAIKHPYIFRWASIICLDEATLVKDMGTKRAEKIHQNIYEAEVPRVYLLTGTPILNRVQEFYSLIAICNYNPRLAKSGFLEKFPDSMTFADYFSHRREYEAFIGGSWRKIIKWEGVKNLDELKFWLKDIYYSMRSNLPPINYRDLHLEEFDDSELLEEFNRAMIDVDGVKPTAKQKSAYRKVPLTISYVKDLQKTKEGPFIIYTDHVQSCHELAKAFRTFAITGEMSVKKRQEMADRFQAGEIDVLCATFKSFSMGYTLTRSNHEIINDYPWSPGEIRQAEFRINRAGQTRPCFVDRIFASEQDAYIFNTVLKKQDVLNKTF